MSKKKKTLIAAFAVMGIVVLGLAAAVYAKYISSLTGNTATAQVAKWAFTTDNTVGTVTCELDKTYDTNTLVNNRIAPGTSGKCPIAVSNESSEVGVEYKIELDGTVTNQPTNLVLKQKTDNGGYATLSAITGTLKPGEKLKKTADSDTLEYIYWEWPYETAGGDTADTTDGEAAETMTITFKITGTQVQPTE